MFLLSATACLIAGGVDAQNQRQRVLTPTAVNVRAEKVKFQLPDENKPVITTAAKAKPVVKKATTSSTNSNGAKVSAFGKIDMATSRNIFGSLVSEATLLDYNGDVNVLGYTNRAPIGVTPPVNNSGIIVTRFSYDKGATWDSSLYVTQNAAPVNRYPGGVIVNPPGNTTNNQAYAVVAGPLLDGSNWDGGTFASRRLDGQNNSQLNIQNAAATVYQNMPRIGMCAGTNGNVYVQGQNFDWNNSGTAYYDGAVINRGVWDATNNNFTWDQKNIYHAFSHDPSDNSQNISSFGHLAFSKDGQTGYHVFIGRDSVNDHLSPMPIIYRTTDGGATWSLYYDGDFTPAFTGIFPNNAQGFMRPFWYLRNAMDVQVDAWGKLHIFSEVGIASSNNVDSLNFLNAFNTVFDVFEDQAGNWNALLIGTIWSEPAAAETGAPSALGWEVAFDARCQITRSADGMKMAYTWLDSDVSLFGTDNLYPDLVGVAVDFTNSTMTDTVNFTKNTLWDAANYFNTAAGEGWDDAGTFVVPVVTARALTSSSAGDQTVAGWMHEYVTGVEFPGSAFTISWASVNQLPNNVNTVSVYPNPGADYSNLVVDLKSTQPVSVNLVNAMGQVVKSFDFGTNNAGSNKFRMDLSDVATGLYVVQMNIGTEVTSRVLSVQK